ncbi:MAG: hypothetical protein OXN83_04030, partial [Oligoflexia bacterium]|nr:hypothetical protein [Oligoflexia bacterium]
MKKLLTLIVGFYLLHPLYGVSETTNKLIGQWNFVSAECEGNSNTEIVMPPYTVDYQSDGTQTEIMKVSFPKQEGEVLVCSAKITSSYTISDNIVTALISDISFKAECPGNNSNFEHFILHELKASFPNKDVQSEFKITDNKPLFIT